MLIIIITIYLYFFYFKIFKKLMLNDVMTRVHNILLHTKLVNRKHPQKVKPPKSMKKWSKDYTWIRDYIKKKYL